LLALLSGEAAQESLSKLVSEEAVDNHELSAQIFTLLAALICLLNVIFKFKYSNYKNIFIIVLSFFCSLLILAAVVTGNLGGGLVYF